MNIAERDMIDVPTCEGAIGGLPHNAWASPVHCNKVPQQLSSGDGASFIGLEKAIDLVQHGPPRLLL
jgi:hypothetical protein